VLRDGHARLGKLARKIEREILADLPGAAFAARARSKRQTTVTERKDASVNKSLIGFHRRIAGRPVDGHQIAAPALWQAVSGAAGDRRSSGWRGRAR
jgi:hypothetical protein